MADYRTRIIADVSAYQAGMAKLPGMTEEAASKAAAKLGAVLIKAEQAAAARAASAAKRAAEAAGAQGRIQFAVTAGDLQRVATAAWSLAQHLADANNALADASTRSALSVETLKGLKLAAEGSGVAFEELIPSLNQFPKRIQDVARGTGEAKVAFDRLGLSQDDAQKMLKDTDAGFRDLVSRLSQIPDAGERAALATQLFGEAGGKFLQAGIASSNGALETFIGHADQFGLETGPRAAAEAAHWQRAMADLNLVLEGTASRLADAVGVHPSKLVEQFTLGIVGGMWAASESIKVVTQDMNFLAAATKALTEGKADIAAVRREWEQLQARQEAEAKSSFGSVAAFWKQSQAINNLGKEAGATGADLAKLGDSEAEAAKKAEALKEAQREAAAAAKAHAAEVQKLQGQLQSLADANDIADRGDAARRDIALRRIEEQRQATIAAGLSTVETEQTFSLARLNIWTDYRDKLTKLDADALEEGRKAQEEMAEASKRAREQQIADAQAVRDARVQGAQAALQAGIDLADGLIDLAMQTAEAQGKSEAEMAEMRKRAALFSAIVSIAQAEATALASGPPPLNFVTAALVGAAGVVQIAKIENTKFHRGRGPADERQATVQDQEAVLSTSATRRVIDALNRGGQMGGTTTIRFQLGAKTLQAQTVRAGSQPGPVRTAMLGRSRPWRSA